MRLFWAIVALIAALAATAKADDAWPSRQVTIIVPFAAGGTTDLFGRMLANHLNTKYGTPVFLEVERKKWAEVVKASGAKVN